SFFTPPLQTRSNAPSFTGFDPALKLPTVHQWNLSVQRELPAGMVFQIGYVGRRGIRLYRAYDLNQINADPILPSFLAMQKNRSLGCKPDGTCPPGVTGVTVPIVASGIVSSDFVNTTTTTTDLDQNAAGNFAGRVEDQTLAARLRSNQQFSSFTYIDSGGDSYYHSMQITLRKRFEKGFFTGLSYTLGKSIDDQSVDPVGASSGGGLSTTNSRTPTDVRDWRGERARSDFDRRHVLTVHSPWVIPSGKGRRFGQNLQPALQHVVGGWSVTGIYTFMSG